MFDMPARLRDDPLIRLLAVHVGLGAVVAGGVVGLLLAFDIGRLGTLVFASETPTIPLLLLGFGFVVTFGSAAAGAAVMGLGQPPARGGSGGGPPVAAMPLPTPAAAPASSARRRRRL
jgi:hypothetical protein